MIDVRTGKQLNEFPILNDGRIYIYIMNTVEGKIKIGQTTNILQRYNSLSGSNSQGNPINMVCVSPSTYVLTMERVMHLHYSRYRLPNSEWFYGDDLKFEDVVEYLHGLFSSKEYKTCNELRKHYKERLKEK